MRYHSRTSRFQANSVAKVNSPLVCPVGNYLYSGKGFIFTYSQKGYFNNGSSAVEYSYIYGKKPDGSSYTQMTSTDASYVKNYGSDETGYGEARRVGMFLSAIYPGIEKYFSNGYVCRATNFYAYIFQI